MFVLLDCKAILLLLVLKQGAVRIPTVPQMKNVNLFLVVVSPEKNVSHYAPLAIVPLVQIVQLGTTKNPVLAGFLCKEMVMQHV